MRSTIEITASAVLLAATLLCSGCSDDTAATDSGAADQGTSDGSTKDLFEPVRRFKGFTCDDEAVVGSQPINEVTGLSGAEIVIRATDEPCQFDLLFRQRQKNDQLLSSGPGGYLLVAGGAAPSGDVIVCASNIVHSAAPNGGAAARRITSVPLECAIRHSGRWTSLTKVADGGGDWAAWISEIAVSQADPKLFRVTYKRDFSFQFLNLADQGRPRTDGSYELQLRRTSDGKLVTVKSSKVSAKTYDPASVTQQGWEPTADELKEAAPYFKMDEGKCPAPKGCTSP